MVLSSTIITVLENERVWPRNATLTDCMPTHVTVRKGHKVGLVQALTVQYILNYKRNPSVTFRGNYGNQD